MRFSYAASHSDKRTHSLNKRRKSNILCSRPQSPPHDRPKARRRRASRYLVGKCVCLGGTRRFLRSNRPGYRTLVCPIWPYLLSSLFLEHTDLSPLIHLIDSILLFSLLSRTDGMRWSPSRVRDVRLINFFWCTAITAFSASQHCSCA